MDSTLAKGLAVMDWMARQARACRVTDVANAFGMARSNAHRTLQTLVECGWAVQDADTSAYRPSLRLFELGAMVSEAADIGALLRPHLAALAQASGETIHLAVLDGADAVMLSGETSVGEHPIHVVETMARIISATERHALEPREFGQFETIDWDPHTRGGVISKAADEVATRVGASYVVAFTQSGDSARRMSRLRGPIPVLAFTPEARVRSQLSLTWGVETFKTSAVDHTDEMVRQ
eukprot:gene30115-33993_t